MLKICDQVREFMTAHRLNPAGMAELVTQAGDRKVNRQDIDNLIKGRVEMPRYFMALARAMGHTVDDLFDGPSSDYATRPMIEPTFIDLYETSDYQQIRRFGSDRRCVSRRSENNPGPH